MDNFDNQDVNAVLKQIDQKYKAARKYGLMLTVGAILVTSVVLVGLIYSIAKLKQEESNLRIKIEKEQKELKELEEKKAEYIKNIAEKDQTIKEVQEISNKRTNSAEKVQQIAEVIKRTEVVEKETIVTDKTLEPRKFPIPAESLTSNVNIRSKPDLEADVIGKLSKGDKIDVVGYSKKTDTWGGTTANWAQIVTARGEKGYVFSPLITVEDEKERSLTQQQ